MVKRIAATFAQIIVMCLGVGFALLNSYGLVNDVVYESGELGFIPIIMLALLILIVVIEIISCITIEDSTVHTVLSSSSLLASYLFSIDMSNVFSLIGLHVNAQAFDILHYLFFLCILLSNLYFINYTYDTKINKYFANYIIFCAVAAFITYVPLSFFKLQYIAFVVYLATFSVAMINVYARVFRRGREDLTFYLTMTIFYVAVGMQTVDILNSCGALNFVPYGYPSMHIFVIIVIFIAVYITFIVRTSREAFKASEYKLQLETLKTRVLREQINPHFTFNTLTVIKSQYHKDLQSGDEAVNMFSRHLRANVEAMDNDFIPFEKELDNLTNYVELQNLRFSSPFKIVYDIACVDFNIPVLSLQVFVENAIKYSKVNQKEDGYIEISSFEEGDVITLKVKDNGTGFNVNNINPNSCGIKNARERFKLLMNANVEIDSRIGVGTEVTITFKKQ